MNENNEYCKAEDHNSDDIQSVVLVGADSGGFTQEQSFEPSLFFNIFRNIVFEQ